MLYTALYLKLGKKNLSKYPKVKYTLFCNFYFTTAKFGLLDVLHTEVAAAVGVDLGFVPRGSLIIRAVSVRRGWEMENTKGHYCGKAHKRANYEI